MAETSRGILPLLIPVLGSQPRVCREQTVLLLLPRSSAARLGAGARPCSLPRSSPLDPGAA